VRRIPRRARLERELGPASHDPHPFDPHGILNPGKA